MIFDRFAKVVAASIPMLRTPMSKSRLFHIDAHAKGVLPSEFSEEQVEFLNNFFLPFPHVCIEDHESCTLMWDTVEGQTGANCERMFADCVLLGEPSHSSWIRATCADALEEFNVLSVEHPGAGVIVVGCIKDMSIITGTQYAARVELIEVCVFNEDLDVTRRATEHTPKELRQDILRGASINARMAMEWVVYLNDQSKFILESTPIHREPKPKKIRPSYDRPIYTVLVPAEIRKVMKLDTPKTDGDGTGKMPHERRAHLRYYRDKRYSDKRREKPQKIEASWIGPKESIVGTRRYRVRVDL